MWNRFKGKVKTRDFYLGITGMEVPTKAVGGNEISKRENREKKRTGCRGMPATTESEEEKEKETEDVNWFDIAVLQYTRISKHHIIYHKYIQFLSTEKKKFSPGRSPP